MNTAGRANNLTPAMPWHQLIEPSEANHLANEAGFTETGDDLVPQMRSESSRFRGTFYGWELITGRWSCWVPVRTGTTVDITLTKQTP
jgi:hypothetical protein